MRQSHLKTPSRAIPEDATHSDILDCRENSGRRLVRASARPVRRAHSPASIWASSPRYVQVLIVPLSLPTGR